MLCIDVWIIGSAATPVEDIFSQIIARLLFLLMYVLVWIFEKLKFVISALVQVS
jgi:hypothetical protein